MKRNILLWFLLVWGIQNNNMLAQGCVAIRSFCSPDGLSSGSGLSKGDWSINNNYRYFKSFRHFRGSHEEPSRVELNTEVINWTHALDINLNYGLSENTYLSLNIPFVYNERSSLYEHGRNSRHSSFSSGLTDIRISVGHAVIRPKDHGGATLWVGGGVKLPTGNFNAKSTFYNVGPNKSPEVRPVDQSIQLGDGGWGFNVEVHGSHKYFYYSGFYLFNPRNTNGVLTYRTRASESIMSVPDQFSLRAGLSAPVKNFQFTAGGRFEGVPVRDVLGKSDGFRRPGYIVSIEPGVNFIHKNAFFSANVPTALYRNRTRSVTDIRDTTPENFRHGDAAFANYLINIGVGYRFPKKIEAPELF